MAAMLVMLAPAPALLWQPCQIPLSPLRRFSTALGVLLGCSWGAPGMLLGAPLGPWRAPAAPL
eukprot:11414525-Alexandrium_andersonii.AAC.1